MPDAPGPPTPIKFPVKSITTAPALSLRRRGASPIELSAASAEARKQIAQIVSATRTPWGGEPTQLNNEQVSALERSLRALEQRLEERERAVEETETKQTERERDLAEAEALLIASERADLLVLGTRGRSTFRGMVLGAVSQRCAAAATCPVVLVKAREQVT